MKKLKANDPFYHVIYWIFVISILVIVFGRSWGNRAEAFYFISLLLPVIMATSYFFNYYLVPKFLLQRKHLLFVLYFVYTVIISLFLEMLVLTFTFVYLLHFNFGRLNPNASDTLLLGLFMYLIVFLSSFVLMVKQLKESHQEILELTKSNKKNEKTFLQIISQRKTLRIPYVDISYIESFSDHIKVNYKSDEWANSKLKISKIEQELPDTFLRIHRSYIVNIDKITGFDYNEIELTDLSLTIGRTYKKHVLAKLHACYQPT